MPGRKSKSLILQLFGVVAGCVFLVMLSDGQASAQCPLSMNVSYVPVHELSIAQIDFDHFESRALLFTLNIGNTSPSTAYGVLHIRVHIKLADGTPLSDPALDFTSRQFAIPSGGMTITNLQIGHGAGLVRDSSFDLPSDVKDKVEDVALGTGKFPAGTYAFGLELDGSSCGPIFSTPIVFSVTNPSRVELRAPRDGEVTNQFPMFEFYQDGVQATLTVAELGNNQSREDAIAHQPPMLQVELNGQNSFLYTGGRPLENGKSYVWQVVGSTLLAGGTSSTISSPIWSFTVASTPGLTSDDVILDMLEQIVGSRFGSTIRQLRTGNFHLNGTIELNGQTLTRDQLLNLLNELRSGSGDIDLVVE